MGTPHGQQHVSRLFEAAVVTHLKHTLGLEVMHEEEIKEAARAAAGSCRVPRGTVTPDVLLQSPAIINGRRGKWIECKNFYGEASVQVELSH